MLLSNQSTSTESLKVIAEVNGTCLVYKTIGAGHLLVLIHGFILDTKVWNEQIRAFAPYYREIRYDLRDFAKSAVYEVVSLPMYPELSEADVRRVAQAIRAFVAQ